MSRLPPGIGMYYDVAPQYDSRHARALVHDSSKLLQEFLQAHGMGRDHPDPNFKKTANELRSQVEVKKLEMTEACPSFIKTENREKVLVQVGRIQVELESHQPFDIPSTVAVDPNLAHSFLNRIGGDAGRVPQPRLPIVVPTPHLNRFGVLGIPPPPSNGHGDPRLCSSSAAVRSAIPPSNARPVFGPSLPPPLLSPPIAIAPTPTMAVSLPHDRHPDQRQLIVFSDDASRASSQATKNRSETRQPDAISPVGAEAGNYDSLQKQPPSLVSSFGDEESSVASSSHRTHHDREARASATRENDEAALRKRYDELMKKAQLEDEKRTNRRNRYDREAQQLAQQIQSISLNTIADNVNAAVGALENFMHNPVGGSVLGPNRPHRTVRWPIYGEY